MRGLSYNKSMQKIMRYRFPLAIFLLLSYLPIGWALGLCDFSWGAPALYENLGRALCLRLAIYFSLCYFLVVWPAVQWIDEPARRKWSAMTVATTCVLFALPPFLSYVYYLGGLRNLLELHEAVLTIVPAVLLGYLAFRMTGSALVFAFFVATLTFLPLFLINDVLSPFKVVVVFSPKGPELSFLRALCAVIALWAGASSRVTPRSLSQGALILTAYGFLMNVLLPPLFAEAGRLDPAWINLVALSYFLVRPSRLGYGCVLAIVFIEMGRIVYASWVTFSQVRLEFYAISQFTQSCLLFVLCAYVLVVLKGSSYLLRQSD